MARHDDELQVNITGDSSQAESALNQAGEETKNLENALKAKRLDEFHSWLLAEYVDSVKVGDEQRATVLTGVLFYIEAKKNPSDEANAAELYAFHEYLMASATEALLPDENGD